MTNFAILSSIILWPLAGILIISFIDNDDRGAVRTKQTALWTSLFPLIISIVMWFHFDNNTSEYQFVEKISWFEGLGISYHLGVDGISFFFIVLTTLLIPLCIIFSWNSITYRVKEYMIFFLMLESLVIGVFVSLDLVLFYLFFEAVLIPMYFIIGIWGGKNRVYASFKFFLYTLIGSLFMLLAMLYIYNFTCKTECTMSIPELVAIVPSLPLEVQKWLWLAFFASFAVKVPMWPVHTWLPDAHVQAPTAGSVVLAGVLLKMGGYGFIRLSLPLFPDASVFYADLVFILSVIAIVYTSVVALVQTDIKKMIAYSSVAHMGFVTIGIFAFNKQSIEGAVFQMISHGLISAALFLCVGVIYDRMRTREIVKYGGLVNRMPKYAFVFIFFSMASIGLPGTSGFVGEFLVLIGVFQVSKLFSAIAALGIILGACYMLWLCSRVVFGTLKRSELKSIVDLNHNEVLVLVPLLIMTLLLGVYPSIITDTFSTSVDNLLTSIALNDNVELALTIEK